MWFACLFLLSGAWALCGVGVADRTGRVLGGLGWRQDSAEC